MDNESLLKTYLVYGMNKDGRKELASVFSLRCSSMNFQNPSDNESFNEILPAIELVYLAVDKMDFEELPEDLEKSVVNNLVTEYTEQCKFLYQAIDIM